MEATTALPAPAISIRTADKLIAAATALFFALLWLLVPAEWNERHAGGKWFLGVFVATSAVAAVLASRLVTDRQLRTRDQPAIWLGIQVLFWNPLAYRAVVGAIEAVGLSAGVATTVAALGLVMLGVPTSLIGLALSRSPSWIITYASRAAACFVTTWVPLLPGLLFLHVLMFAQLVTWHRFTPLHRVAVGLVVFEQLAAFAWAFSFGRFD